MATEKQRKLFKSLSAVRAKGEGSFPRRYRSAHQIARLAYNSSLVEGRHLSQARLREAARELLDQART
jgi:hypothetical protein